MKAWRIHELGRYDEVLRLEDVDEPGPPEGDEVVIDVAAVGLNFPDLLLAAGLYQEKPPMPFTPGLEVAGTIRAAGPDAPLRPGQRVTALPQLPRGGLVEQMPAASANVFALPDAIDDHAAAALTLAYQTGHVALHRRAGLQVGETLLVHGGAGGVGSAAIQLGKAAGALVIATAGGEHKTAACAELGADIVIDYAADDFVAAVKDATEGRGADVIFDPVGGDVFDRSNRCIAFEGRLLVIGFTSGRIPEANTGLLLVKNYAVVGVHWGLYRSRNPQAVRETHAALMDLHAAGEIAPRIHATLPFEQAPEGFRLLESREAIGKVVVTV